MCTLTWFREPDRLTIFFNRDEKRTRAPARPPQVMEIDGVRVLAPIDGDAGGSWLAANENGLVVALLNYYDADITARHEPAESRGLLVLQLAAKRTIRDASVTLAALPLFKYRPFLVAVMDEYAQGRFMCWNGRQLSGVDVSAVALPVSTSSFNTGAVLSARRRRFEALRGEYGGLSVPMLAAFHHGRDPLGGAYSVTMTRPDAATVSLSRIEVRADGLSFFYEPRMPDGVDPGYEPAMLARLPRT